MRILYSSNGPWCGTGYGVQGKSLLPRLAALPEVGGRENVGIFAWFGLQGGIMEWDGFKVYPGGSHPYGVDMVGHYASDFSADVVITLIDIWTQQGVAEAVAPAAWWPWFPVDGRPLAAMVRRVLLEAPTARPLLYSHWGQEVMLEAGFGSEYVPHGIEPDVFRILPEEEVRRFRGKVFPGCDHLTVMVSANKGADMRKAFDVQLRAWALFAEDKPGARMYIHTEPTSRYGGPDLRTMAEMFGILDKVWFADSRQYWMGYPPEYLALLYNAADVYLGASKSEGFGIPLLEAQACGCPVIATDFSSMSELVYWGELVRPRDLVYAFTGTFWAWPDVDDVQRALEELYEQQRGMRWGDEYRKDAEFWAHKHFGWDTVVAEYWAPLMRRGV
jgi:glycosyltransferase involved in cell wall biosynthesis